MWPFLGCRPKKVASEGTIDDSRKLVIAFTSIAVSFDALFMFFLACFEPSLNIQRYWKAM